METEELRARLGNIEIKVDGIIRMLLKERKGEKKNTSIKETKE